MPSALQDLYATLHDEKRALVKQAVTDNKFHRLAKDDKLHVSEMSDEIKHYEQYIKDLREARALNSFIRMVQNFAHVRFREIRNELRDMRVPICTWTLRTALERLEPIVLRVDQLLSHLRAQRFRGWNICCCEGEGSRYRPEYRYAFPKCEFGCPLVIRNANICIPNVVSNMYTMIDLFSKLCGTRVYTLDRRRALWLGRRVLRRGCYVREASADRLWLRLHCPDEADKPRGGAEEEKRGHPRPPRPRGPCVPCDDEEDCPNGDPRKNGCIQYNAVWIPDFQLYIRLRERATLRDDDVCIRWCDTVLSREQVEAVLHYFARFRAGEVGNGSDHADCCVDDSGTTVGGGECTLDAELYLAEHVDWDLFTPLQMEWLVRNSNDDATHVQKLHVESTSVRSCTTLEGTRDVLSPGFVGRVRNIHVALRNKRWGAIVDKLVAFYDDVVDRVEAMQRANDNEKRQIESWQECVHSNICMQREVILEYIGSNRALVDAKISGVNKLIESLEKLIAKGYE